MALRVIGAVESALSVYETAAILKSVKPGKGLQRADHLRSIFSNLGISRIDSARFYRIPAGSSRRSSDNSESQTA